MNTKIVAAAAAIVAIAALFVLMQPANNADSQQVAETSLDVSNAMDEGYTSVMQEELDSMTDGQDAYTSEAQSDMLDDMSSFYE